jgi:hypothetical protein
VEGGPVGAADFFGAIWKTGGKQIVGDAAAGFRLFADSQFEERDFHGFTAGKIDVKAFADVAWLYSTGVNGHVQLLRHSLVAKWCCRQSEGRGKRWLLRRKRCKSLYDPPPSPFFHKCSFQRELKSFVLQVFILKVVGSGVCSAQMLNANELRELDCLAVTRRRRGKDARGGNGGSERYI